MSQENYNWIDRSTTVLLDIELYRQDGTIFGTILSDSKKNIYACFLGQGDIVVDDLDSLKNVLDRYKLPTLAEATRKNISLFLEKDLSDKIVEVV